MANFLKQLIENDKKDLKRLEHLANKVEALKEQTEKLLKGQSECVEIK